MKLFIFLSFCLASVAEQNAKSCTSGFTLVNNKCWKLYSTQANHTIAERTCTNVGGTLFMTKNAIDNKAIAAFISSGGFAHAWMGLFCIGNDKSFCYFDDQTGSPTTYNNFAPGFPNSGVGRCVYYAVPGSPGGQWINGDCTEKLAFVCELPPTIQDICDFNFNNNCYFRLEEQTFSTAQQECQQMCGNMVSIHSAEENRYITSIYSQYSYDAIRIGGIATSKDFVVWTDGSIMNYSNLEVFGSSGNCLWLSLQTTDYHSKGSWFTGDCSTPKHFVCKRPIGDLNCGATPPPPTAAPPTPNPPTCSTGTYMAPGSITSPNFSSTYRSSCYYTLATYGSNKIRITFNYIYTYGSDIIYMYDGESADAPLIATRSGTYGSTLATYTSTGSTMFIYFKYASGVTSGYPGFNATFYSVF
ncbi:hypothetical protein B9Z55_008521 [Caenorhabditis nigoni]|uniref:C-type lectin domain-containing protein n=1 Tax=Caenorhabditis nigoni TaxID=1611254 RepID=A0A2G5UMZ0_9PELO|nr:hypothetical protein B9Z55_008521 [Caenorhabditis nigoni]